MAVYLLGGTTLGQTTLSHPNVNVTIGFSGHVDGATALSDTLVSDLGGIMSGATALSVPFPEVIRNLGGRLTGRTILLDALPTPMYGLTTIQTIVPLVQREPRAVLACACPGPKTFRWGQVFQRGDLTLFVTDPSGTPSSPYEVTYTVFWMRAPGVPHQVGPTARRPIMQKTGEYYVTGTAGELGQPGDWQIAWTYRRSFNGPPTTVTFDFRVVDAVLGPIYTDPTCRKRKYGWED
jgi:hypothetical protein